MRVWQINARSIVGYNSVTIFICLAVVASQICEIPRNSTKIWTYSSSRSSKVTDLGVNRKRICNFLLVVINSNYGRITYSFRDWPIDAFSSIRKPSWSRVTRDSSACTCIKDPSQIILSSSMLPVDFLLMVNSMRAFDWHQDQYLSLATHFCVRGWKSPFRKTLWRKNGRLSVQGHPRLLILVPIESACTHSY